jgi:uncharacterized protein (TIGR02271 family)
MQELIQAGFIQDDIDLSNRSYADTNDSYSDTNTTTAATTSDNQGIGDKISNFFSSLFDDETTASNYTNAAYDADAILTVQADSAERAEQAAAILDRHGAMDVDGGGYNSQSGDANYGDTYGSRNDLSQNYAGTGSATDTDLNATGASNLTNTAGTMDTSATSGTMNTDATMNTTGTTGTADYDESTRAGAANLRGDTNVENREVIPVVEENLEVGKRAVERGGARIRSRVIEKPVEANVRLREEHVVVNRRPVNRAVTDADINNFQQGDIELTERAEVPVVSKQARVVEEVEVGKTVEEREETIRDTVRRTDVDVQEIDSDVTDDDLHSGTRRANS